MVFSSNEFLFFYLPLALLFYFLAPKRARNAVLLVSSLVFYGWERPIYLPLMIFVIAVSYAFGIFIGKTNDKKRKRLLLTLGVAVNLGILAFFKYANFFFEEISHFFSLPFAKGLGIALPIGISFYVFQSTSYIVDVYRGACGVQDSFVDFATYVSMFPQLIAGPIVRYSDVERELKSRSYGISQSASGARRFVLGLTKKVLLADTAGAIWERIRDMPREETSVLLLWLGIVLYSFQIYFDFSGYSDMAIGLGKILGFHFPENFNYPYISKSITEFWRRWHITLSSYFREYVYFPLGGSRRGVGRLVLNLLVVWLLTGLWHGADRNFVLWGFYYFVLLCLEKLFLKRWLDKAPSVISRVYTLVLVAIGWLVFAYKSELGGVSEAISYLSGMLGMGGIPLANAEFLYIFKGNALLLIILTLGSTPSVKIAWQTLCSLLSRKRTLGFVTQMLAQVVVIALLLLCVAYITASEYRPNIYFEF